MTEPFSTKLAFVLKVISLSRGALAAELGVHKSVVGRWVSGPVKPSDYNLARLSEHIALRIPGFAVLDWERPIANLAAFLGADPDTAPPGPTGAHSDMLPMPMLEQSLATTAMRGGAYEGFYRSTRPYAQRPGWFMHDHMLVRKDPNGHLRFDMGSDGVLIEGWVLLAQNQLFIVSAERTSGAFAFGILNGVNTLKAGMLDGLILYCALDPSRAPVASAVVLERVGDISDDRAADDARFTALANQENLAPEGSVPADIMAHLSAETGPSQIALGGDWLLTLPLARSLSRGLGPAR